MKRNNNYVLKKLSDVPYLMTFGQSQADLCRGVKLNETGEFLWNLLEKERNRDELVYELKKHYNITDADLTYITADLDNFLNDLLLRGILTDDENIIYKTEPDYCSYIRIAGLNLCLRGRKDDFFYTFESFACKKPDKIHQTITLINRSPEFKTGGRLLLKNNELSVTEYNDYYALLFPSASGFLCVHMSKDAGNADFYYTTPCISDTFREDIYHAIRLTFLYLALQHKMSVLHSASLLYKNHIWLFSGMSGTGKSTHTKLWHKLLNTPLINGDLNLISLKNNQAVVHGIPWCGTSEIFDAKTYTLGGIILLKQSPDNYVEELSCDKKALLVSQRLITPSWTEDMLDMNLDFTDRLLPHILVCRLHCSISDEAVYTIKNRIDGYLSETGTE